MLPGGPHQAHDVKLLLQCVVFGTVAGYFMGAVFGMLYHRFFLGQFLGAAFGVGLGAALYLLIQFRAPSGDDQE